MRAPQIDALAAYSANTDDGAPGSRSRHRPQALRWATLRTHFSGPRAQRIARPGVQRKMFAEGVFSLGLENKDAFGELFLLDSGSHSDRFALCMRPEKW